MKLVFPLVTPVCSLTSVLVVVGEKAPILQKMSRPVLYFE